jgi:hypothetical protein
MPIINNFQTIAEAINWVFEMSAEKHAISAPRFAFLDNRYETLAYLRKLDSEHQKGRFDARISIQSRPAMIGYDY